MARQKNDGRGRIGGRGKGTGNKKRSPIREWISGLLDGKREQIENDLMALEPYQRLVMLEKLLQYVTPKQQAVSANVELDSLSDAQIDLLVERLTKNIA